MRDHTENIETLTLGMGCFWSPDALFGSLSGVQRTRVGYAGGHSPNPTYREMGDHSETVEIDFDPGMITIDEILNVFWNNHNPLNINGYKGRQYMSLLFYRGHEQQEAMLRVKERMQQEKGKLDTDILPYTQFYMAEDRHQKYYLKRYPNAVEMMNILYCSEDEITNSTLAARLNGLAKGYTNLQRIKEEIEQWSITPENQSRWIDLIRQIRW